jgi:ribose 5-phosphate isomerase B
MNKPMKIGLGSDHAGYQYKEQIKAQLLSAGHEVVDFGTDNEESCDYPLFVHPVALGVSTGELDRGIVLGGSGNGEAIVSNRVRGVRCAVCWNNDSAYLARRHNDANMIAIGQRMMTWEQAKEIVEVFLAEPFDGGRHERRIRLIAA